MDYSEEYLKIANMTNKEAAEVIRSLCINVIVGRGNGKTMMSLKYNTALMRAITILENLPDEATCHEVKEATNKLIQRGLRANIKPVDESAEEFNKVFITTSSPYTSAKEYTSRFELAEPEIPWEKFEWKQESELLSKKPEWLKNTDNFIATQILGSFEFPDATDAITDKLNKIPLINAYTPEAIKAGLEKAEAEEKRQNDGSSQVMYNKQVEKDEEKK